MEEYNRDKRRENDPASALEATRTTSSHSPNAFKDVAPLWRVKNIMKHRHFGCLMRDRSDAVQQHHRA